MATTGNTHPLICWAAASVCLAAVFALFVPPFQYPDEPMHLTAAYAAADNTPGALETAEKEILAVLPAQRFWELVRISPPITPPDRFYEAPLLKMKPTQSSKPRLFYRLSALILIAAGRPDPVPALMLLRLFGVSLFAMTIVLTLKCLSCAQSGRTFQNAAFSLVLTPQFLMMGGAYNPATLSYVGAALMLWGCFRLFHPLSKTLTWTIILSGFLLAVFSHRAALAIAPAPLVAAFLAREKAPQPLKPLKTFFTAASAGTICLVLWIILAQRTPLIVRTAIINTIKTLHQSRGEPGIHFWQHDWWTGFFPHFHRSVWLSAGWLKINGPPLMYLLFAAFVLIALIGLIRHAFTRHRDPSLPGPRLLWTATAAAACMLWAGMGIYFLRGELSQGRYLFPAWPAFAVIWGTGWLRLIPPRYRTTAAWLLPYIMLTITVICLLAILLPQFYA